MRKINIIDIFNPTKLRDWLNELLSQGGTKGDKGDSVEYVKSNAVHDGSGGFTTVTVTSKIEGSVEQSSTFKVPDGKDGVVDPSMVDYGLSVKDGKLNLGRYDEENHLVIIDTPKEGYDAFLIGRVDEDGRLLGFVKHKGYMRMVEGDAYVTISADKTDDLIGASPKFDGKNRIGVNGYRVTITGENEIILATSQTGAFSAGIMIDKDNNSHAHNKVWDKGTLIVNNQKLTDEISKLEIRIAALEAK